MVRRTAAERGLEIVSEHPVQIEDLPPEHLLEWDGGEEADVIVVVLVASVSQQ